MTILVAVSRDHVREKVIDMGLRLGKAFDQELYVVHLLDDDNPTTDPSQIRAELRERVLGENVVATVAVESVDPALVRAGPRLGRELLDLAEDDDITHIVVGHTSQGLVDNITRGNTAFTVADAAPVPVTIIPESVPE